MAWSSIRTVVRGGSPIDTVRGPGGGWSTATEKEIRHRDIPLPGLLAELQRELLAPTRREKLYGMTGPRTVTAAATSVLIMVGVAGCGSTATRAGTDPATTIAPTATSSTTSAASTVPPATVTSFPTSTAPVTTTMAPAIDYQAQAQYLQDVAASDVYTASIRSATYPQLDKLAGLVTANARALRQQSWPGSAQKDVGNLATALDALASDLRAGTVTGQSLVFADAKLVRADLGLEPPSASNQW